MATSTAVSFVVRLTDALRIVPSPARRAFYQGFARIANRLPGAFALPGINS
jgi:predicted DCC family thiol-disulfide oxidoreductase YuxK